MNYFYILQSIYKHKDMLLSLPYNLRSPISESCPKHFKLNPWLKNPISETNFWIELS